MTLFSLVGIMLKKHFGLYERTILIQSAGTIKQSGVVRLMRRILSGTLIFETFGALMLMIRFIPVFGGGKGVYYAVFHSISAFCNAGFDLMGILNGESSLMRFVGDPVVNLTMMFLIFMGGIGFFVWNDIWENRFNPFRLTLHSKIALSTSGVLIIFGWLLFFLLERNASMKDLSAGEKALASLFQAVSPRTAGFFTVEQASLSEGGAFLTMLLMLVGGSSGSTAGGIKVTTAALLIIGLFSQLRNNGDIVIGKKRIEDDVCKKASMLLIIYLTVASLGTLAICSWEPFGFKSVIFESVSALGTVGLSMGITPHLKIGSKLVLTFLMYAGRVGALTLAVAVAVRKENAALKRPTDKILIG